MGSYRFDYYYIVADNYHSIVMMIK